MKEDLTLSGAEHISVEDDCLYLPFEYFTVCQKYNVVSARSLVSFLYAFPTAMINTLNISKEELEQFTHTVVETLRGHIPDAALERREPIVRTYGAANPTPRYDDVFVEGVAWLDNLAKD